MSRIICHRGACLDAPENTLASAHRALEIGGDWIELDIRQSRDGVLYVLHDATVDRTTDGTGAIAAMDSAEIDALDAGAWFAPRFAGERVPRLEPFLDAMKDRAGGFYLELKSADCAAVAEVVAGLGIAGKCMHSSFDPAMRKGMRRHAPDVAPMVHWRAAGSVAAARQNHGARIVEFFADDLDDAAVRACQKAGLMTQLWAEDDDPALFRRARDLQLDFVNTDHIASFQATRARPAD